MIRTRLARSAHRVQTCVICTSPIATATSLCTRDCLLTARDELEANTAERGRSDLDAVRRTALTERHSELTAAVIGWCP